MYITPLSDQICWSTYQLSGADAESNWWKNLIPITAHRNQLWAHCIERERERAVTVWGVNGSRHDWNAPPKFYIMQWWHWVAIRVARLYTLELLTCHLFCSHVIVLSLPEPSLSLQYSHKHNIILLTRSLNDYKRHFMIWNFHFENKLNVFRPFLV